MNAHKWLLFYILYCVTNGDRTSDLLKASQMAIKNYLTLFDKQHFSRRREVHTVNLIEVYS